MRGLAWKAVLAAMIAGSGLLVAAEANASDRWDKWDRWDRKHHRHHHHDHGRWRDRDDDRRRVVVDRRPIVVAPAPILASPFMGGYGPPMDPSVNFNFSFPMR